MDDPATLDSPCLEEFVVHSSTYYNRLLRDLDERIEHEPPKSKPYTIVPPLLLKRSLATPRARHSTRIGFSRPGTARTSPEELQRREENRIELLCEIEAKKAYAHMTTVTRPSVLMDRARSTGLEQKIEEELIEPYRRNDEKYEALMARVEKIEKRRAMESPRSPRVRLQWRRRTKKSQSMTSPRKSPRKSPCPDDPDTGRELGEDEELDEGDMFDTRPFSPTNAMIENRRATVLHRRNTLMQNESEMLKRATEQWNTKVSIMEADKNNAVSQATKCRQWLVMLTAVNKMRLIGAHVKQFREIKRANLREWNASKTIQRYWRKFCPSNRGHAQNKSFIHMFRKSMGAKANRHIELFQNRVKSATIITNFLKFKGFKVSVLQFLQRVRRLQRKIRAHLQANKARCDTLSRLIDACLPPLLVHINIVAAGRGYDLKNVNSYEENQIHRHNHRHRMCKDMQTPAFHQFLRQNLPRFALLFKDLLITTMANNKQYVEQYVRKPILLDYVFKRRRQFGLKFNSQLRIDIDIPKVTVDDVRRFIQDGVDPITNSLWALAKKEREMLEDYYNRKTNTKRLLRVNEKIVLNTMQFYKEATVTDVVLLILTIYEKANLVLYPAMMNLHHLTALAASGGVNVTSGMIKRQSVMSIDPKRLNLDAAAARISGGGGAGDSGGGGAGNAFKGVDASKEESDSHGGTSGAAVMTSSAPLTHRRPSSVGQGGSTSANSSRHNSGDFTHTLGSGRRPSTDSVGTAGGGGVGGGGGLRRPSSSVDSQSLRNLAGANAAVPGGGGGRMTQRTPLGPVPEGGGGYNRPGRKASVLGGAARDVVPGAGGVLGGGSHSSFQPSLATVADEPIGSSMNTNFHHHGAGGGTSNAVPAFARGHLNRIFSDD